MSDDEKNSSTLKETDSGTEEWALLMKRAATVQTDPALPKSPSSPTKKIDEDATTRTTTKPTHPSANVDRPKFDRNVSWGDEQNAATVAGVLKGMEERPDRLQVPTLMSYNTTDQQQQQQQQTHSLHSPSTSVITTPDFTGNKTMDGMPTKIEMIDVLQAHPLESEAETYVIRSLEQRESGMGDINDDNMTSPSLLGTIPDESKAIFVSTDIAKDGDDDVNISRTYSGGQDGHSHTSNVSPSSRSIHTKPSSHKRVKSTMENTLAGLTDELADLHKQDHKQGNNTFSFPNISDILFKQDRMHLDDNTGGSGDVFAKAANVVLRKQHGRPSAEKPTTEGDGKSHGNKHWGQLQNQVQHKNSTGEQGSVSVGSEVEEKTAKSNAKVNWGKLRVAVGVTAGTTSADHKKHDDNIAEEDVEIGCTNSYEDLENDEDFEEESVGRHALKSRIKRTVDKSIVGDLDVFVRQRRSAIWAHLRILSLIVVPGIGLACIFFYFVENPPVGFVDENQSGNDIKFNTKGKLIKADQPSYSWWILFLGVRMALSFSLAKLCQVLVIEFCCLNTKIAVHILGQFVTLFIVQSKGWPFLVGTWAVINFALNCGDRPFHRHWLYWQDVLDVFNETNYSGNVPDSTWFRSIQIVALVWGAVVTLKRFWLGLYLGKKTYSNYAEELAKVMSKVLLLCKVAALSREVDASSKRNLPAMENFIERDDFKNMLHAFDDDHASSTKSDTESGRSQVSHGSKKVDPRKCLISPKEVEATGSFNERHKSIISELLGAWEEPDTELGVEENVSISGILQFRQSLSYLNNDTMFSLSWGDVSTRERMILSSQVVYQRLLTPLPKHAVLNFDVLAMCCIGNDGEMNIEKLKDLIKMLRPDRDGSLTMLDFVKSVDAVYKEAKLLRASVRNNQKIDRAFEQAINIAFYIVLICITLSQVGIDPFALFLSLSSLIVGFAFMIGAAASRAFEGCLFILVRRPYGIGDRIHVSNPDRDLSFNGSPTWFVRDVDLYTTTVVFAGTGEKATLLNGSLASSRVINAARSPNPCVYVYVKFPIDTPLSKVEIFDEAIRKFVKSRPREWAQLLAFRVSVVAQELGYVEYMVMLQHRESWQNLGAMLASKAELSSFTLELSKKLDMRYVQPPMPITLNVADKGAGETDSMIAKFQTIAETAGDDVAAMFARKQS